MLRYHSCCFTGSPVHGSRAAAFTFPTPQRRWVRPQSVLARGSRHTEHHQRSQPAPQPLNLAELPLVPEQFKLASSHHISLQSALLWAGCAVLFLGTGHAHASGMSHVSPQLDIAESEDFWANVVRYGRFFITVMLGTTSVMLKPFAGLFKKPVTAIVAIVSLVGGVVLLKVTLEAMLGMSDPLDYLPVDSAMY